MSDSTRSAARAGASTRGGTRSSRSGRPDCATFSVVPSCTDDGHAELFGRGPQRLVIGMVQVAAVRRVRAHHHAATAVARVDSAPRLRDRGADVALRAPSRRRRAARVGRAVVGEPVVVGAAQRGLDLGVLDAAEEQAGRREQHRPLDALGVHVDEARLGVEAAGRAVRRQPLRALVGSAA